MDSIHCPTCGLEQPIEHHFCVRCGIDLPTGLLLRRPGKHARFFTGVKVDERDPENGFLRVSCYGRDERVESEGESVTVATEHVRFSVWVDDTARCVLSIPASEAKELTRFLDEELRAGQARRGEPSAASRPLPA
jgi:hypothetical protein